MGIKRSRIIVTLAVIPLILAACSSSGGASDKAATAKSAADMGGMEELVKAAEAEGALNVIAAAAGLGELQGRPRDLQGQVRHQGRSSRAGRQQPAGDRRGQQPDGHGQGARRPRPRRQRSPSPTPPSSRRTRSRPGPTSRTTSRSPTGLWVSDYAGFMSIGCDANKVAPPATVADLLKPEYKGMIALNGNPQGRVGRPPRRRDGGARQRRLGGRHLRRRRRSSTSSTTPGTCCRSTRPRRRSPSGQTPCVIDWEYNNAAQTADARRARASTGRSVVPSRRSAGRVLLLPGHQQGRAASRGRPPVAGVPVHAGGPERLARRASPDPSSRRR